MCLGARSPTGSPTSAGFLAMSTAVLTVSTTSPTISLPNMPAALWPGIVHRYSNVPALVARNTMVVALPSPTSWSDCAPKSGTAMSCIAPSPLTTVIATTAPSGTFSSGATWPLIGPASPMKTSWPSWIAVFRVKVTSATGVTSEWCWAATAIGVNPAAVASANNRTRSFIFQLPIGVSKSSFERTLGLPPDPGHDLDQARPNRRVWKRQSPAGRTSWHPYATVLIWIRAGMRGVGKMAIVKNPFHPRCSFRYWLGRLALAAMLALVLMPTAGRLYLGGGSPSTAFAGAPSITLQVAGHGDHATAHQDASPEAPVAPGPRHA